MNQPHQKFGQIVHALRRKYLESRRELSAALEINVEYLDRLEQGKERPTEELVEQLVSHFNLDDGLAHNLWLFAGYPYEKLEDITIPTANVPIAEARISYTDSAHISANNFGVVLNFMQNAGPNNQPLVVSRLGMSKEHAKQVADLIYQTIAASEQARPKPNSKNLPAGN